MIAWRLVVLVMLPIFVPVSLVQLISKMPSAFPFATNMVLAISTESSKLECLEVTSPFH